MLGRDLIVIARRRAGFSQRELAARVGRPYVTIGRWESGATSPSFDDVLATVAACGFEPSLELLRLDGSLIGDSRGRLQLAPLERVRALNGSDELVAAIAALAAAGLRTVIVGEAAAALQGWPLLLPDGLLEVVVDDRDRSALKQLLEGVRAAPVTVRGRSLWAARGRERFALPAGTRIELLEEPAGTRGYADLAPGADRLDLGGSVSRVAGVLDLIRMAEASAGTGAPRFVPALHALLDAQRLPAARELAFDSPEGQAAVAAFLARANA